MLYIFNMQWHRILLHIPINRNVHLWDRKLYQGKKQSRVNSKSCSIVSNTLDFRLYRLRWPSSCNFSYISQVGYSLSLYAFHFSRFINSLCISILLIPKCILRIILRASIRRTLGHELCCPILLTPKLPH